MENISGITVDIPPQIDKNKVTITVNDQMIDVSGMDKIMLINAENGFSLGEDEAKGKLCKGTGLLDPFVGAVRIINILDDKYVNIVNNLCYPSTNGFWSGVDVNYPVLDITLLKDLSKTNLVVLDNCTGSCEIIEKNQR